MSNVLEFEPLVITATAPRPLPPILKVGNAIGFLGSGILWWAGWRKTAVLFGGLGLIDVLARQLSPAYAKDTEQFYGWRR